MDSSRSAEHRPHRRPLPSPIGRGATRAAPAPLRQEEAQAGGQQQRRASATAAGERVRILILRRIIKEAQAGAGNEQAEAGELNRMRRRTVRSAEHRQHRRPLPIGRGGAAAVKEKAATAAGERVRIILILRRIQTGN